ncbi:MAG: long-chain-fatty-acid--CoA ligase [Acidimicrobiales bacterium]
MQDRYTVAGLLRIWAKRQPGAPMLVDGAVRRTWEQQYRRSCRVAQALAADGVGVGDRVAFLDRNGAAYFDVLFGGALLGAVNVAVNWRLAPVEMGAVLDDSAAGVLVVHPDYLPVLDAMPSDLSRVRRIVVLGDSVEAAATDATVTGSVGGADALVSTSRGVGFEQWLAGRSEEDPGHVGRPDEVSVQLYTSGTTGLPKGVMLTNANLATATSEAGDTFHIAHDTVSLVAMPLFHIGGSGWALCGMSRGGVSVVLRDVDPVEIIRLVESERITETFVVPAVLMFLLATPGIERADLSSLRTVFYGASPISEDLLVSCLRVLGCDLAQVYGMTETTGAICSLASGDHDPDGPRRHLLRSAGRPFPHVAIRIVDPDAGADMPTGQVGEIWTRSPYNMAGYWGRPDETQATITDDGWLRTGDAGYLDGEGYVYLHDRIKDMIVTGGENVYPAEVENVVVSHPDVVDAAVIGVPDERWGETVKAVVVAPEAASLSTEERDRWVQGVIAHCRERLAHYKCPSSVDVVEVLPRNPSGKVLKRELRGPYWEGASRSIS